MRYDTQQSGGRPLEISLVDHRCSMWVELRGDADLDTEGDVASALRDVQLADGQSVHLHLAQLQFVDIRTMRLLSQFACRARTGGHAVLTCRPPARLRNLAQLLGLQEDLGILPHSMS